MDKYNKYTFYIGLNDKNTKKQVVNTMYAQQFIITQFFNAGIDCTLTTGLGCYTHDNGSKTIENSIIVECIDFNNDIEDKYNVVLSDIKFELNQESIAIQKISIESCLF